MREIAPGVWQLTGVPRDLINAYLVGDVLIDAGTRLAEKRLLKQLRERPPRLLALTHCHPDHQGCAKAVCEEFNISLACHADDAPVMEGRAPMAPANAAIRLSTLMWAGPPHPVGQVLRDGDEVAGFRVVHTPGHTSGHVLFFRAADRVAIAGDVMANLHYLTGRPGLHEPPTFFSVDPAENRRSIRKLVELDPAVVCFGHGPPLTEPALLRRFVERLA